MKHNSSLGRLWVETLVLPEEILQALEAHRFRSVRDIMAFGVSNVALLWEIDESGSALIEAALLANRRGFLQKKCLSRWPNPSNKESILVAAKNFY